MIHVILISFNIINAFIDAYKIKTLNKVIRHFINFAAYFILVLILCYNLSLLSSFLFILSAFFNRQITFDIVLNFRRGLKWDYVSLDNPPKALMDRLELRLFGYNGRLAVFIYSIFWIITIVLYVASTI